MKRALGNLERQLFAYTQLRNLRALRTRDLTRPLGISGKQERELLSRLARAGMIAQVRRGLYLVPPGSRWGKMDSGRNPRARNIGERPSRALPDLRAQRLQPLWLRRPDPEPRLRLQRPHVRGAHCRVGGPDAHQGGGRTARRHGAGTDSGRPDRGLLIARADAGGRGVRLVAVQQPSQGVWSRYGPSCPQGVSVPAELVRVTLRYGDVGTIRRMGALLRSGTRRQPCCYGSWSARSSPPRASSRGTLCGQSGGLSDRRWGVVWNDRV